MIIYPIEMHKISKEKKKFLVFNDSLTLRDEDDYLYDLKKEARDKDVPVISDECENLLKMILDIKKPKKILELGTAVGYSALFMARNIDKSSHIDTVENYKPRINKAKLNFKKYDKNKSISLYDMDIDDYLDKIIKNKTKKYDLIFLDAAKAQYIIWLPMLIKLLNKKGIIIADNVLVDNDILESRYTIRKRDRSIHKRMREYLYAIFHDDKLMSYLYDIGDGVSVTIKR